MQINTSKNILIITLLFVLPISLIGQSARGRTDQKKYWETRSGDTTIVVMEGSGLRSSNSRFLLEGRGGSPSNSRYKSLKEAVNEVNQMTTIIEQEKNEVNPSSGSLSFRIAQKNRQQLQNEREAQRISREKTLSGGNNASVEELVYMIEKFGHMPSYFVNGIQVDSKVAAAIPEKEILTRDLKVSNTTTGNPNGEVWFVVPSKVFERLGLDSYSMPDDRSYAQQGNTVKQGKDNYSYGQEELIFKDEPMPNNGSLDNWQSNETAPVDKQSYMSSEQKQRLSDQQREVEELKRQIEEAKIRLNGGTPTSTPYPRETVSTPTPSRNVESEYNNRPVQQTTETIARRTNTRPAQAQPEVVSFKDSPQERSRRDRDRNKNVAPATDAEDEVVYRVVNQVDESLSDPSITTDTPKRSVRRIKDRERNR